VCVSSASTGLCGGQRVTAVPTATVGQQFRPGNMSPEEGVLEFAQECEAVLPAGPRIYFRSDSAAYQAAVIHHYSQAGRSFSITADLDAAVKGEIQHLPETAW
jgi:hypothetical protein